MVLELIAVNRLVVVVVTVVFTLGVTRRVFGVEVIIVVGGVRIVVDVLVTVALLVDFDS